MSGRNEKNKAATNHVMRNLQKPVYHALSGRLKADSAGEMFPMDSLESYTRAAKAWLGDNTELSSKTIDNADYREAYEYFGEIG